MATSVIQVDAFTARPFAGNPAAVCMLDAARPEDWMQNVAREMNLSETAFLVPRGSDFDLRWFTPSVEVALCGHATLASAHVLWEDGHLPAGAAARFQTMSGLLTATRNNGWIELDFPATPESPAELPPMLAEALGAMPVYTGRNQFDYLVELESEKQLRSLSPDYTRLRRLPGRGIIVTARSCDPQFDFVSRFFAPAAGVDEDPVTGSAHCCLAPYWAAKLGKTEMTAFQSSPRGGVVRVRAAGERTILAGQAITVLRGELTV